MCFVNQYHSTYNPTPIHTSSRVHQTFGTVWKPDGGREGGGGVFDILHVKKVRKLIILICVNPIWYIDNVIVSCSQGCSFLEFLPQFVTDWLLCLPVSVIGFPYFFEKVCQFGRKWKWKLFYVFKQRPQDFYTGIMTGFPQANVAGFNCKGGSQN